MTTELVCPKAAAQQTLPSSPPCFTNSSNDTNTCRHNSNCAGTHGGRESSGAAQGQAFIFIMISCARCCWWVPTPHQLGLGISTLFFAHLMEGAPALSEVRPVSQVSLTLKLVLSTGCTEGVGSRRWGQGAQHTPPPRPDPHLTAHPGGGVGAFPLPVSMHQSRKEAESWVKAFLGGLLCSGNPGITPFQRGKALGLGIREPELTFQAGLEFTLAQWLREDGLQGPCCSPVAIFKDTAPHTSCPLSVPRRALPSRPPGTDRRPKGTTWWPV